MNTTTKRSDYWFVLVLGMIYMFNFIDRTIISVVGELIRRDLVLSDLQLGLMGGLAFSFFYAIMGIPLARLAERFNRVNIIVCVTAIWSVMTMLSGAAGGFLQLLLCRMGVGVGEAGFTPALVSMISDRFPPERRAVVFSLIAVGVPVGGALAAIIGSAVAQAVGWRLAFVVVGLPGLVLALLLYLTVPEPVRSNDDAAPPLRAVLTHLRRSPAFIHLTFGSGMVGLVGFGLNLFLIPLLVRLHGLSLPQAGLAFALSFSLATAVGTTIGGFAASALGHRDQRWYAWAPALLLCAGLPLYLLAIYQSDWRWLMGLLFVATACLYAFLPTIMTVTQTLVEPRMRASAAAIHSFGQTVLGLGLGSVLLGYLSDRFASAHFGPGYGATCVNGKAVVQTVICLHASAAGLQQAMMVIASFLVLAIISYLAAARSLKGQAGFSRKP
ncbi:MAG: transporter [Sphingomonadales bacterium]|nr:transporter [Sphingomonadales bacterium]